MTMTKVPEASPRVQELKKAIIYKTYTSEGKFRGDVKVCLERARLMTQSFKETDGEVMVIRRAKALAKVLENMTIYIKDGELIVGNYASTPHHLPLFPELSYQWIELALGLREPRESEHYSTLEQAMSGVPVDRFKDMLEEVGKEEFKEIVNYWQGKSIEDRIETLLPEDLKDHTFTSVL